MADVIGSMKNLGFNDPKTISAMRGANVENFQPIINGRQMRPPLRMIHIFSVAKRSFTVSRPLFPRLQLRGCEDGERYVLCTSIPDPVPQSCIDEGRGDIRIDEHDGWVCAVDLLNPGNFTMDLYNGAANPNFFANTSGMNLVAEGLFASINDIPTEYEISQAENARDKHYQYLAKESQRLAAVSTARLNEFLQQYPDTSTALDALGIETNFHSLKVVKHTCPNCGDMIKKGMAFHQSSAGILCILDPEKAFKAGAITRERFNDLTETVPAKRGPGRPPNAVQV
jgi:hypothetical protein